MRSPVHKLFQDYATIYEDVASWVLLYVTLVSWFHLDWLVAAPVVDPVGPEADPVGPAVDPVVLEVCRMAPEIGWVAPEIGRVAPEVGRVAPEVEQVVSAIGVAAVARLAVERHFSHCRRCASRLHTIGGRTDLLRTH